MTRLPGVGFTFPGVVYIQDNEEDATDKSKDAKPEVIPDPKMIINPLTPDGKVTVEFNQDMLAPPTINQNVYKYAFVLALTSDLDDSVTYGRFKKNNEVR